MIRIEATLRSARWSSIMLRRSRKGEWVPCGRGPIGKMLRRLATRPFRWRTLLLAGLLVPLAAARADTATAPIQAPPGVTALSGVILDTNGDALQEVIVSDGAAQATTDGLGRFLLSYAPVGTTVLAIDGRHTGQNRKSDHGFYYVQVTVVAGQTNILPFISYLPLIDHSDEVTIASPSIGTTIVKTKSIPGLELRIPPGTVIRGPDGKPLHHVSITAYPTDRTPFPVPPDLDAKLQFTIQPGGACLYSASGQLASVRLRYPNDRHELPGARATLYRYDADHLGWVVYGTGTVDRSGAQIVPDASAALHDFDGTLCATPAAKRRHPDMRIPRRVFGVPQHD